MLVLLLSNVSLRSKGQQVTWVQPQPAATSLESLMKHSGQNALLPQPPSKPRPNTAPAPRTLPVCPGRVSRSERL